MNKELEICDSSVINNDCSGHKCQPHDTTRTRVDRFRTSSVFLLADQCKRKWRELVPITLVELVLELHPMEPQGVKECAKGLHNKQHTDSGEDEDDDANNEDENVVVPTRMHKT